MNKFKLIVYSLLRIKQYNTNENINILLNNFKLYYMEKTEKDFNINNNDNKENDSNSQNKDNINNRQKK